MITSAKFIISATNFSQSPHFALSEVAFLGRSNVGKSSLINALTRQKNLAKSSATPGKTRLINFFEVSFKLNLKEQNLSVNSSQNAEFQSENSNATLNSNENLTSNFCENSKENLNSHENLSTNLNASENSNFILTSCKNSNANARKNLNSSTNSSQNAEFQSENSKENLNSHENSNTNLNACENSNFILTSCKNSNAKARKNLNSSTNSSQNAEFQSENSSQSDKFTLVFVDLPGFGYAKVSHAQRAEWDKNLDEFLKKRQAIRLFVHLRDARHENLALDESINEYLQSLKSPSQSILQVFTKADKLNQSQKTRLCKTYPNALLVSSAKNTGLAQLESALITHTLGRANA